MNIALVCLFSAFCGALVLALIYGLISLGIWVKTAVERLYSGFSAMANLAEQLQKLIEIGNTISMELQLLRSAIGNQPPGSPEQPAEATSHPPSPPAPFPAWNPSVFVPVTHEAEIADTVIDDTDDERMVKLERVEELRQQGIEVDPAELEEG